MASTSTSSLHHPHSPTPTMSTTAADITSSPSPTTTATTSTHQPPPPATTNSATTTIPITNSPPPPTNHLPPTQQPPSSTSSCLSLSSSPLSSPAHNSPNLNPNTSLPSPTPPPSLHLKPLPPPPAVLRQQQQHQNHHRHLDGETSGRDPPPPPAAAISPIPKSVAGILRRSRRDVALRQASLASRVAAAVLSLISFSVMAADKTKGWAGDSYDRYREYRYCITVNIITFVYSSFQIYMHVHHMMTNKFNFHPPFRYYFDLFFDQMLAYLMISASSAATARNYGWIVSWGSDPFTVMMNGSISMSYLAFAALAISSLISAHYLFSRAA